MFRRMIAAGALALLALAHIAAARSPRDVDPAIWVVRDADTTIYLFGTFHLLDGKTSWFNDEVKTAFDASQEVELEAILPENPTDILPLVLKYAVDPSGTKLSDRLTPETKAKLDKQVAVAGLPVGALESFEPWYAATALTTLSAQKLGLSGELGPEAIITKAAKAAGKRIGELESVEKQLAMLDALPDKEQLAFLQETIDSNEKLNGDLPAMLKAWSKGDMGKLARMLNKGLDSNPGLYKALLTDRNVRWTDWIGARLDRPGTVFMAVGAGHLAGKDSVLALLASRGLKPVRYRDRQRRVR